MKAFLLFLLFSSSMIVHSQDRDAAQIRSLLNEQTASWNKGDIEGFMQTYWKSDSLMFIGKSGVTWGWQQTLDNYKKGYPDQTAMGTLSFNILQVKRLSTDYFSVVGKWMLKRTIGDVSGHFTLLLRKIEGRWVIVSDHSS